MIDLPEPKLLFIKGYKCKNPPHFNFVASAFLLVVTKQTHGLPPEEPGREEDSPGALR